MNTSDSSKLTVNIPVKIERGQIKYLYGNGLPKIKDGSEGNLIILQDDVLDKDFACKVQREKKLVLFEKDEHLLIAVNIDNIPQEKWKDANIVNNVLPHVPYRFIEIILKTPLYLLIRGTKKSTLNGGECVIPVLSCDSTSINSAYTKISETYETKRISHTANVFNKCFYFDTSTEYWTELDRLREIMENMYESELYVKDNNNFDNDCVIGLNLNETEIKLIKYIETFGDMTIEKIREVFGTSEKLNNIITELTNKGIISRMDR